MITEEVNIFPNRETPIVLPLGSSALSSGLFFICGLEPETLSPGINYTTRWRLPGERIVNSTLGRFVLSETRLMINNRDLPGTLLVVTRLSYEDAGTYACEGRNNASGVSATQWATASFELQLNGKPVYEYQYVYYILMFITVYSGTAIKHQHSNGHYGRQCGYTRL